MRASAETVTTTNEDGTITIPADLLDELGIHAGDRVAVGRDGDTIRLRRPGSVALRTAGAFRDAVPDPPLTLAEEREAFERAVAEEVSETPQDHW